MSVEFVILIAILSVFAISVFILKMPAGVSLMLAAIAGALVGGEGLPVRHLVEGSFGFLEAILIISTAMIFMKVVDATGALKTISYGLIKSFHRFPLLLMIMITLFIMFPGMLTGLSSACILTTGALVVPALLAMGIPPKPAGALIAMAAVFGEIAPPICIPAMIIGGGVDMPYIGFAGPLFIASFPPAILTAIYFRYRFLKQFDINEVLSKMDKPVFTKHGFKLFLPMFAVISLLIVERVMPETIPHLGIPLIFVIGTLLGFGTGDRYRLYSLMRVAVRDALPVMSILIGVGMFIQIMALTGVRGFIAVSALEMPESIKYLAGLIMPFFGSAYASASVVGVPLVFVFIGKSEIVVASALALLAAMGDLMPPPSLLCAYAGQLVKVKNHFLILKECIVPIVFTLIIALTIINFSREIGNFLTNIF